MNKDLISDLIKGTSYQEEAYKNLVVKYIREKYSTNDEIAIMRQAATKPSEYEEYYKFVEDCKVKAKQELGINLDEAL